LEMYKRPIQKEAFVQLFEVEAKIIVE